MGICRWTSNNESVAIVNTLLVTSGLREKVVSGLDKSCLYKHVHIRPTQNIKQIFGDVYD